MAGCRVNFYLFYIYLFLLYSSSRIYCEEDKERSQIRGEVRDFIFVNCLVSVRIVCRPVNDTDIFQFPITILLCPHTILLPAQIPSIHLTLGLSPFLSLSLSPEDVHSSTSGAICCLPSCTQRIDCFTVQHPKCSSVYQQQCLCTCADDNGLEAFVNCCKTFSVYSSVKMRITTTAFCYL